MISACAAREPARIDSAVFADIARELTAPLTPDQRIALQPFKPLDVPVSLTLAQDFNAALARAIETNPAAKHAIVAREELPRLFAEAEEFGDANTMTRLLVEARADVLVIGAIKPAEKGVEISYKAFDARTGRQLASTPSHFHPADSTAPRGQPLEQALALAVEALAIQAPDMKAVETLGIRDQLSAAETALGSYIGREIAGRLTEKISGAAATPAAVLAPGRTELPQVEGGANGTTVKARAGVYVLSGTLWDLGADVDVRLSLRGAGGQAASAGMRIRRDGIPVGLLTASSPSVERMVTGPVDLKLSSDRGQRPVYAVGDSAQLIVQTARDGYLYCFHQSSAPAGGGIIKIFPNPYHRDPHVAGQSNVRIPASEMDFALRVQGPAGIEHVRCFVADRDVSAALPAQIAADGLVPLDVLSLDDVGQVFRALPAAQVAEASLVMTIAPPR